ncbi:MAG: histidine kinase [Chitinophagaceae bacterium]|nr:histidine kinase [Chitinophagaceae bacterium]
MKASRHIAFWLVYCLYFYIQSISPWSLEEFVSADTYKNALTSLYCFVPISMLCAYVSMYVILPFFIERRKYLPAVFLLVLLFAVAICLNYFGAGTYYRITGLQVNYPHPEVVLGYLNAIWAMIVSLIAMGIRITKKWYSQQKEIEEITRQKTRNELNLRKTSLHPGFLYSSLESIHEKLNRNDSMSSSMILLLSNILSYSLYESKTEKVTLRSELNAVSEYITLEKLKGSGGIDLNVDDNIDPEDVFISPMSVLSVLQDDAGAHGRNQNTELVIKQKDEEITIAIHHEPA